ncbi:TIR domain containing protein [Parasponia andersonii]|uniref:TIR domain containing protein n=1 Tax=Parasponia andersonii TaxID=3476 RepID=A0A2P5BZK4_PARAD|nr:TIR domain containing protein [Parasponia andersonii]
MGSCFSSSRCDVFISFRGEDTRDTFTSHLYDALTRKKITTYMDDKLKKGDEISPTLTKAIKRAKLSVIVFSENYAASSWCLDELIQILECKEKKGQIVVPIFYHVDPSDVRKQKGSYTITSKGFKGQKRRVDKWRKALNKAANLSGWDSRGMRPESKLIEEIVKDVRKKLEVLHQQTTAAATMAAVIAATTAAGASTTAASC